MRVNLLKRLPLTLCAIALSGCFTVYKPVALDCVKIDDRTVKMFGPVNEELQTCAETLITDEVDTVIVSSWGGDVTNGQAIGDIIAQRPRTVVIEGACMSSCGNYFVPTADKLVLKPGAYIALHGTIDPYTIHKNGVDPAEFAELVNGDIAFAQRHKVPKGWRLYREADYPGGIVTEDMSGEPRPKTHKTKKSMLMVERAFLESCLPHVSIAEAHIESSVRLDPDMAKEIKALGGIWSGTLRCR